MTPNGSSNRVWPAGFYPFDEPKRVKCSVCDRRFRNLPALNGHMRLHGGYMKKEATDPGKKSDTPTRDSASPTTSVSKVQLQKRSVSSHHLFSSGSPRVEADTHVIVVKPEVNCGGSVMSVNPTCGTTFPYVENHCTSSMSQNAENITVKSDLSSDGSQNNLFAYNWIDGERSAAALETVTVKPEPSTDGGSGQVRPYEDFVAHDLELTRFVGSRDQYLGHGRSFESQNCMSSVCLGNAGSSQQHTDGRMNNGNILAPDVNMDSMKQQQMLVDDGLSDYGFSANTSPLMSSQSMPLLPTYSAPEVIRYPAAEYRMPGMFTDKGHPFVDASFSHNGTTPIGYGGVVQHDMLANEQESVYGRCFNYPDHGPHEVMHYQNSDQQRPNPSDGYFSSVPRTPTLYTAVGPKPVSQQSGHRTPRTPYTPSTPGRASRFQFPSITEGAVVGNCQHRYQKPTAYHPYGHQHTPSQAQQLTTLGPASPHYLNQRHVASMAHEMNQQQFQHDVAHAQQEIEQRLQQLQHEDKLKQMMITQQTSADAAYSVSAHSVPTSATNGMSADASVRNTQVSHGSHDAQSLSSVDEVLQLLMHDTTDISRDSGNDTAVVPITATLQLKSEAGVSVTAYPHSASDSLLSQLTCTNLAYDQTELKKLRRKHKPEPLVIPPDVNNFGSGDAAMQWSKMEFAANTSTAGVSSRMAVGSGAQWVQQNSNFGEPRSAPPFHWSSAVMSFSNFDADSVLADLPP